MRLCVEVLPQRRRAVEEVVGRTRVAGEVPPPPALQSRVWRLETGQGRSLYIFVLVPLCCSILLGVACSRTEFERHNTQQTTTKLYVRAESQRPSRLRQRL